MSFVTHAVLWMLLAVLFVVHSTKGQAQTRCSTILRAGSSCVDKKEACPAGTTEYLYYSNYIGCFDVDQKCCQPDLEASTLTGHDRNTCGIGSLQVESRILDGFVTGVCDWPFVVSLRGKLLNSDTLSYSGTTHVCQGVLIDPLWVLTSPYCLFSVANTVPEAPDRILVVAGEYNVSGIDISPNTGTQQEQVIRVDTAYVYPTYPFSSLDEILPPFNSEAVNINSDGVALIKLAEPINGQCSGIACLPTAAEAANGCAAYETCIITGWGFNTGTFENPPEILLLAEVRLASYEACDFLTNRLSLDSVRPRGSICQAPRNRNTDSCLGDEGGAVLCSTGHNWVVRGILPFNTCENDRFNLFVTDVAPYLQWIESTINSTATFA